MKVDSLANFFLPFFLLVFLFLVPCSSMPISYLLIIPIASFLVVVHCLFVFSLFTYVTCSLVRHLLLACSLLHCMFIACSPTCRLFTYMCLLKYPPNLFFCLLVAYFLAHHLFLCGTTSFPYLFVQVLEGRTRRPTSIKVIF